MLLPIKVHLGAFPTGGIKDHALRIHNMSKPDILTEANLDKSRHPDKPILYLSGSCMG